MKPKPENRLAPAQLLETAKQQRRILLLLLISIPVTLPMIAVQSTVEPGPAALAMVLLFLLGLIVLGVLSVIATYRLVKALQLQAPWVYVLCSFIPYVSMVTMLIINGRATAVLNRAGIHVGLMGADPRDLERVCRPSPDSTTAVDT